MMKTVTVIYVGISFHNVYCMDDTNSFSRLIVHNQLQYFEVVNKIYLTFDINISDLVRI